MCRKVVEPLQTHRELDERNLLLEGLQQNLGVVTISQAWCGLGNYA